MELQQPKQYHLASKSRSCQNAIVLFPEALRSMLRLSYEPAAGGGIV